MPLAQKPVSCASRIPGIRGDKAKALFFLLPLCIRVVLAGVWVSITTTLQVDLLFHTPLLLSSTGLEAIKDFQPMLISRYMSSPFECSLT